MKRSLRKAKREADEYLRRHREGGIEEKLSKKQRKKAEREKKRRCGRDYGCFRQDDDPLSEGGYCREDSERVEIGSVCRYRLGK